MCHVLKLNRSSFYKWVNTRAKRRLKTCSDALLGARIKTIFDDEHGLYGAKRIAASLNNDTDFPPITHKKVARIMKSMGLKGFTKRRRCITTRRKPGHRVMPEKSAEALKGQFSIPITAVCTPHKHFGTTAPSLVYANPWERWERVPIMPWQNHLTPVSSVKFCVIGKCLTIQSSAAKKSSDGACATTRADGTPGATF